jgi:hypothetical protein
MRRESEFARQIVHLTRPTGSGKKRCILPPLLGVVLRGRLTLFLSIVVVGGCCVFVSSLRLLEVGSHAVVLS